jgi:hypothetical protein
MLTKILLIVVVVLVTFSAVQTWRASSIAAKYAVAELARKACAARAANLLEDKESDNEVDNLSDDGLRVVPDNWLLRLAE